MPERSSKSEVYALRRVSIHELNADDVLRDGEIVGSLRGVVTSPRKSAIWHLTMDEAGATAVQEFKSFSTAAARLGITR